MLIFVVVDLRQGLRKIGCLSNTFHIAIAAVLPKARRWRRAAESRREPATAKTMLFRRLRENGHLSNTFRMALAAVLP